MARTKAQGKKKVLTPSEARSLFLDTLADTANVSRACKAAGVPRRTAYNWRRDDKEFAAQWDEMQELGNEALEDEAVRRGHEGYDKPVYQGGVQVGTVREYSDTLLIFMLKGRRPEKFKDRQEFSGRLGGDVVVKVLGANQSMEDL